MTMYWVMFKLMLVIDFQFLRCIYEVPNHLVEVYAKSLEILDQVECGYVLHATIYVFVEHVNLYVWGA